MIPFSQSSISEKLFADPVTSWIVIAIVSGLIFASILIRVLRYRGRVTDKTYAELLARTRSWYVLSAAMVLPILLGHIWVCVFFYVLGLFCFREYAKATRLAVSKTAVISVTMAISVTYYAALANWWELFSASTILGICTIAVISLLPDAPKGYIQRLALSVVGFSLFGISLGHLAFLSNAELYRSVLLWILICTELNDVFAYMCGKTLGRRKFVPNTSPNKTLGGAIGAVIVTTALAGTIAHFIFSGTSLDRFPHLVLMGILISVLGQAGDLLISSIKRDLGVKDMSSLIPGHGGLLDRFDSLLMVAPAVFHYMHYFYVSDAGTRLLFEP